MSGLLSLDKSKIDVGALEGFLAELERREETWTFQRALSNQDIEISRQEIAVAQFSVELAKADLELAELERAHAADILTFLQMKNLTAEAYRWMAIILGEVYREVLQSASTTARMAERALAFQRYERPVGHISSDYWQVDPSRGPTSSDTPDLKGLTGSARLLRDIGRLEDHAIASLQRRQQIELRVDLALLDPEAFHVFRQTGVLEFEIPLSELQSKLPGYYMAITDEVSLDLIALASPSEGLRMTLESRGISRAVVRTEGSITTVVRGLPEVQYMTGLPDDRGRIQLRPDQVVLRRPFEGTAFNQFWRLTAPKEANLTFDYEAIAGLEMSIRGTALYSPQYAVQVLQELGPSRSGDVVLSLSNDFPTVWETLTNPEGEDAQSQITLDILRERFPVNLNDLSLSHILIAVVDSGEVETAFDGILFTPEGGAGAVGGPATTVDGRISTRNKTGTMLRDILDGSPFGTLELRFDNDSANRFATGEIADVFIIISFAGQIS